MTDNCYTNLPSFCTGTSIEALLRSKNPVILFLLVICVAVCMAAPSTKGEVSHPIATVNPTNDVERAPSIKAAPERVRIEGKNGRSDIRRITGELYADAQRHTLLASATASGISESRGSVFVEFWRRTARWLPLAVVIVVLYVAVYVSSTGTMRTRFPVEPAASPRQLHVARNLLLGLVTFACLDGVIFHTGLYASILAPASYAGRMANLARAEKQRRSSGLREVLVVGDSRIAEAFSAAIADKLGSRAELKFVDVSEPALSSLDIWYYALREADPSAHRYTAIVFPMVMPTSKPALRISMAAPVLRYGDCFEFASGFERWPDRFRAFTAAILRGSAYQADIASFLEHPLERVQDVRPWEKELRSRAAAYQGRDDDIVGTSYDPKTGQVTFPPRLTEYQRNTIRFSLLPPSQSDTQYLAKLQRHWIQRILRHYSASPTAIILMPTPRGPFGGFSKLSMVYGTFFGSIAMNDKSLFVLPEHMFDFLEAPEYYFDGYHLNAKGRQKFTERLVAELVKRLQPADSRHLASDPN